MSEKEVLIEPEHKATFNDKGEVVLKKRADIKRGKKSRADGAKFELAVRKHLEADCWKVDKWSNNVDLNEKKLVQAKRKFNPFSKVMTIGTGFPDFIAFRLNERDDYEIIGVEVKTNGILSREEKDKCIWLLENKIFKKIFIAKKGELKGVIEFKDFSDKKISKDL
jgi:hypothetical protein